RRQARPRCPRRAAALASARMQDHPPTVSVALLAFQHAPYVQQAIDSVLAQETTFPVEIVIGEDGSTDGTRDIVFDAQTRHPDRIRVLEHGHLDKIRVNGRITGRRNWL